MKWLRSRTAVVALVAAVAVLTIALGSWQSWPAQAQPDLIVNDDTSPTEDGCDSPDHNSIQAAINAAGIGQTIMVCEGTYQETPAATITINTAGLTIEGREAADRAQILITGSAGFDGLTIENDEVVIRHLTLDGPGTHAGIYVPNPRKGVEISDLEITHWRAGVEAFDATEMVIEESDIHASDDGVHLKDGGGLGVGNVVQYNSIGNNNDDGLDVEGEDQLLVQGNTLSENDDHQVEIKDSATGWVNVRILDNQIVTKAGSPGIWIDTVPAEAFIQIGGSPENANRFSGPGGAGQFYVRLACDAENTVDAIHNWWGTTVETDIGDNLIFNDELDTPPAPDCAVGPHPDSAVVFRPFLMAEPTATPSPTPSPTATPSPTPTPTATPSPTPAATPVAGTRTFDLTPANWHNFVWTGATGTPPTTALQCIEGDYSIAYRWMGTVGTWQRFVPTSPDPPLSDMTNLSQFDALLVYITASGVTCENMPVVPVP